MRICCVDLQMNKSMKSNECNSEAEYLLIIRKHGTVEERLVIVHLELGKIILPVN